MAGPVPSKISTSFLKSRILNIAQTSVYQVKVQPPPSVIDFLNQSPRKVSYDSDGVDIELLCTATTLPGQSLATHDQPNDYPGVTEKMVYRKIYDDRTDFTFYVDKKYRVIEFFEAWIDYCAGQGTTYGRDDYINRSAYYRMNYPKYYKTDSLYIAKFEKDAGWTNVMDYRFIGAFPISIAATPVSYDTSDTLKCTVSFSYMRYLRQRSGTSSDEVGFAGRWLRGEMGTPSLIPLNPAPTFKRTSKNPQIQKQDRKSTSRARTIVDGDIDASQYDPTQSFNDGSAVRMLNEGRLPAVPFEREGKKQFKKNNETNPWANYAFPF